MMRSPRSVRTMHGVVRTPFFMPDATRGSVRGIAREDVRAAGVQAMVVNTYHLMTNPGAERIAAYGGIHALMGTYDLPLLSDSGGYQVYSLINKDAAFGRITATGAIFRDPRTGARHELTPARAIDVQAMLGTDMMVVLDDPQPNDASRAMFTQAVERTVAWAAASRRAYARAAQRCGWRAHHRPLLFAVIQGGPYADLRAQCAAALHDVARTVDDGFGTSLWDGMGFGGRHVDAQGVFMEDAVAQTAALVGDVPLRFALGVGTPEDIVRAWRVGWEMFDCVIPTREGRHGRLFVLHADASAKIAAFARDGRYQPFYDVVNVRNAAARDDGRHICVPTPGVTSACYTRAYVAHLLRNDAVLAAQILARANLAFYTTLMRLLRTIAAGATA